MGCSPSVVVASSTSTTAGVRPGSHKAAGTLSENGTPDIHKSTNWSDPVELTEKQTKLVSKSMRILRPKLNELGAQVFKTIFTMRPDLKKHFGFEGHKDEELEYNVNFRTHSSRFIAVVNCAIEALAEKNDEEVTRLFHGMGAQHLQVTGFNRSNFSVFKEALMHCIGQRLGEDKFKGELFRAWDLVVKFIIQRLQDGYMAAKAQKDEQDRSFTSDQHHDQVHIDLHLDRDNDHDGSTAARNI